MSAIFILKNDKTYASILLWPNISLYKILFQLQQDAKNFDESTESTGLALSINYMYKILKFEDFSDILSNPKIIF